MRRAVVLVALVAFPACQRRSAPVLVDASAPVTSTYPSVSAPAPAARPPTAYDTVRAWERAEAKRDVAGLAAVYAPRVKYYGVELDRAECTKRAGAFFDKKPEQTFDDLKVSASGTSAWASVRKRVVLGKDSRYYFMRLALVLDGGSWSITEEIDSTTEGNLFAMSAAQAPQRACDAAVRALTDDEMKGAKFDDVQVSTSKTAGTVQYFGTLMMDEQLGGMAFPIGDFSIDLVKGTVTRNVMSRDQIASTPISIDPDPTKMKAAQKACASLP